MAGSKTTAMTIRVTPDFKRLLDSAARLEQRSRTNLIEKLVFDHCRDRGLIASIGSLDIDRTVRARNRKDY